MQCPVKRMTRQPVEITNELTDIPAHRANTNKNMDHINNNNTNNNNKNNNNKTATFGGNSMLTSCGMCGMQLINNTDNVFGNHFGLHATNAAVINTLNSAAEPN